MTTHRNWPFFPFVHTWRNRSVKQKSTLKDISPEWLVWYNLSYYLWRNSGQSLSWGHSEQRSAKLVGNFVWRHHWLLVKLGKNADLCDDFCTCWWLYTDVKIVGALTLIARFIGPTWGPSGASRTQMGPILAPWTLLSGYQRTCQAAWLHERTSMQVKNNLVGFGGHPWNPLTLQVLNFQEGT